MVLPLLLFAHPPVDAEPNSRKGESIISTLIVVFSGLEQIPQAFIFEVGPETTDLDGGKSIGSREEGDFHPVLQVILSNDRVVIIGTPGRVEAKIESQPDL